MLSLDISLHPFSRHSSHMGPSVCSDQQWTPRTQSSTAQWSAEAEAPPLLQQRYDAKAQISPRPHDDGHVTGGVGTPLSKLQRLNTSVPETHTDVQKPTPTLPHLILCSICVFVAVLIKQNVASKSFVCL